MGRFAPAVLVAMLAIAWLVPGLDGVRLASGDDEASARVPATLDSLPDAPVLLVGFDPDLGTYAEIRPTVRTLLADLLARDARLAFISLTPEGRALLLAELARLDRGEANPTRILDLGFIPGAEAALVSLARGLPADAEASGALARRIAADGMDAVDGLVVVGGNDIGPRSWIEQLLPRVRPLPMVAVAPSVLLPELQPFVATGQIDGLLATPRDGAAYRDAADLGRLGRFAEEVGRTELPVLVGLLAALAFLGHALATRWLGALRRAVPSDAREP